MLKILDQRRKTNGCATGQTKKRLPTIDLENLDLVSRKKVLVIEQDGKKKIEFSSKVNDIKSQQQSQSGSSQSQEQYDKSKQPANDIIPTTKIMERSISLAQGKHRVVRRYPNQRIAQTIPSSIQISQGQFRGDVMAKEI